MNIRLLLDLIRYHYQKNELEFNRVVAEIASYFRQMNKPDIADHILAQASSQSLSPQSSSSWIQSSSIQQELPRTSPQLSKMFQLMRPNAITLYLPECLENTLQGIHTAVEKRRMLNKFLFVGAPGTGKTEAVKKLATVLGKQLYSVNFTQLIDSRMGQTAKNIESLFEEIEQISTSESYIYLFDEIDGLALTRTDSNDIREMGRATTAFIRGMDFLTPQTIIFATTNLGEKIDAALRRRFDLTVNFNCYEKQDLINAGVLILRSFLNNFEKNDFSLRIARKIFELSDLEMPGMMKNRIRTVVAFSDPEKECSFLPLLYKEFLNLPPTPERLREQEFSLREIELLTGTSKSQLSRILSKDKA